MNSEGVGLLLVESSLKPIYANPEALEILSYPTNPREIVSIERFLADKIQLVIPNTKSRYEYPVETEFVSGRRRYLCRAFTVEPQSGNNFHSLPPMPQATLVLLLERSGRRPVQVGEIVSRFHLTHREKQTLEFLLQGLTSKEIAARMQISPNTVKAFVRMLMIKMGASTRPGIVGKILDREVNSTEPSSQVGRVTRARRSAA